MRRSPLSAFGVCTTCVVLLMGCEAPVEPQQPAPPPPPSSQPSLSFEISGPGQIDTEGSFTWHAVAFGGSGAYQYRWEVTRQAGPQAAAAVQPAATTTFEGSLSLLVTDADGDLLLRLTVRSGDQTQAQSFRVRNCIGGCNAIQ